MIERPPDRAPIRRAERSAPRLHDQAPGVKSLDPVAMVMRSLRRFLSVVAPPICRVKLVARGVEHLAPFDGRDRHAILAANHHSILDTPAILELLPRPMRSRTAVVSAIDVFGRVRRGALHRRVTSWFVERLVCDGYFAILVDRGSADGFRRIRRRLELGWNVLLYPEGTRSRTGVLGRFQSGAALLARETGVAVVPLWVTGSVTVLPVGARWPRPGTIDVTFGAPLSIEPDEPPECFTQRLRTAVAHLGEQVGEMTRGERPVAAEGPASNRAGAMLADGSGDG